MARLFILIRKRNSKRFLGAILVKKGVSSSKVKRIIAKQLKAGFIARVVSSAQLKRVVLKQRPRPVKRVRKRRRRVPRKRRIRKIRRRKR